MADEDEDEKSKGFTINKFVVAIVLFVGLGFLITTVMSYNQTASTQTTLEQRAAIGDVVLELNKEQSEQLKVLIEEVNNIKTKLENLEKAGKSIR